MVSFIDFPIFNGVSGDLRPWISWLEDFFVREKFTALEKMNLAQSLLEGEANAWFYSSRKRFAFQSWEHLVVELLLWRFGDFGDGGVFSDLELFLLWNKYDRILRKRRKRMSRTAITPQESISSSATIPETITVDKFSNQQVDEISAEKKESKQEVDLSMEKIASQLKLPNTTVHVSDSENLRNIETRIENSVLDNFESVVKEAKIQTNIRLDVVNGDDERIQRVMSSSKNVSAHQVLDKMCQLKRRQPKNKRKLSLSPKSWMFKFKNMTLPRNWSQLDLHQVIDISKVNNLSPCVSANFGLVRTHRPLQCLRLKKQAHKSRVQYHLRRLHDPGGKKVEHYDAIFETEVDMDNVQRTPMDTVAVSVTTTPDTVASSSNAVAPSTDVITERQRWDEACDAEIDLEGTGTYIVTSLPANIISIGCKWLLQLILDDLKSHLRHKWKFEVAAYSLSFDVATEEKMSSGLSHTSQVWEPGGVLADHVLMDWLMDFNGYDGIVDGIKCLDIGVCSGIKQPIDSRRASRVWERGGLTISTDRLLHSGFDGDKLTELDCHLSENHSQEKVRGKMLMQATSFNGDFKLPLHHAQQTGLLVFPWNSMLLEFFLFFYFGRQAVLDQITKGLEMKKTMKVLKSWMFKYKPATSSSRLPFYVNQMGASDIQGNDKEMVAASVTQAVLNLITNVARFGLVSVLIWVTVWRVLYLFGTLFWSTSFKKQKFGKNWWYKFKHSFWQRECGRELLVSEAILAVRFDVIGRRELLLQWQNRDESEHSWMLAVEVGVAATVVDVDLMSLWRFSKAFVHLSPSYQLEDKLGLQGVSIDTLHHAYRRKKGMTAQQVFKSKERVKGKTLFLSEALPLKSQELI